MKIRKINKPQKSTIKLKELINQNGFHLISLSDYVADTVIQKVYFAHHAIRSISSWVQKSIEKMPVHEVGGFLLGRYEEANSNYLISVEQFISATQVADSGPSKLDFGIEAILELEEQKEKFPNLELMGWFHTHPGHSPYLSATDFKIHNGFFTQPYQIALVIDSLTTGLETGIFSRKLDQTCNNKTDYLTEWLDWKSLESAIQ